MSRLAPTLPPGRRLDVERDLHVRERSMNASSRVRPRSRGFTLVELMAVVGIVSILAIIGLVALRKRVFGSKSTEALAMIQSIRAAEERWKAENLQYLDCSPTGAWYPADPTQDTRAVKRYFYVQPGGHPDAACWTALRPVAVAPVEFGYLVNAGLPLTPMKIPVEHVIDWPPPCNATTSPPACNSDPWYVIQAIADLDHDKIHAYFLASHLTGQIYRENEGE